MRSVITANGSLEKKTMSQMLYQEIWWQIRHRTY
jgi:hypothetical protein